MGRYLESDLTALSLEVRRGDGFTGLFASGSNPDLRRAVDHALQTVHSLPVDPSTIAGVEVSPRAPPTDQPTDPNVQGAKIQPPAHTPDSSPPALAGHLPTHRVGVFVAKPEHRRVRHDPRAEAPRRSGPVPRADEGARRGHLGSGQVRRGRGRYQAQVRAVRTRARPIRRGRGDDGHRDVRVREGASGGERGRERHRRGDYASGGFPRVLSPPTGPGGDRGDAHERGREGPDAQRAGRGRAVALRGSVRARGG